ncbi:MAG: alpha/beta hydrolase, partial [Mycobacterium sp.]
MNGISRRNFARLTTVAAGALTVAACSTAPEGTAAPAGPPAAPRHPLGAVKQIDAGELNVGYVEAGPADGQPVILLHGWPYDIHSYADVTDT